MNKMKIKIFTLFSLIIAFSLAITSCNSLWDDLSNITVSFDSNSGTGTMEPQEFVADVPQTLKENTFTKEGYNFAGWALSASASEAEYADKANFTAKQDTTLYAVWSLTPPAEPKVKITYVSDAGTPPQDKEVKIGYKLTAEDLPDLTADGYNFKGWDKFIDDEITEDTTITASWKKTWKITYSLPSGYSKEAKVVEEGYKLTAEDLPNYETATQYGKWDKTVGTEITADTTITANWETIVYLKNFKAIFYLALYKGNFEKTIFTEDTYTGDTTNTIDCSEDAHPGYFTGVISSDNKVFTIYGNGHKIFAPVDSSQLFSGFNKLSSIEFNNFSTSNVTNMMAMFAGTKLTSLDVSKFNTSKVTDMTGMFETCEDITSLDLSSFDTSSVTNMTMMFKECKNLTALNVSSFDTSKVTDMSSMFDQCEKLVSLNLSNFKTSEVTTMGGMFYSCKELTSLDVSKFDTSSVSNMKSMFEGCEKLTVLDISSFDFSSMPEGKSFKDADFNVFKNCSSLVTIYATNNFQFTFDSVFEGCSKLVGGAGTACNGTDNINASYACIDTASTPGYFTLKQ